MAIKKKVKKLKPQDKKLIEEIIRVDHAGEHGATQIYRGQLAIFNENTEFGKGQSPKPPILITSL